MKSPRSLFVNTIAAAAALFAALVAGAANAATIHGNVVNGTTGAGDVSASVALIEPSAGMAPIRTIQASKGQFSVDKLTPGIYLARVDYEGVTYNKPFEVVGDEHVDVTVTVYETTSSWEGVRVFVPHFTATRHGDHLSIERVYDINNEQRPPRTITGEDGYFRFPLPSQMHEFNGMFVQYGEVPIQRQPVATDEDGVYLLDYPIRPGVTRVIMAYSVAYDSAAFSMNEKLRYDIDSFTIFATDSDMKITSSSHELVPAEDAHAAVSWTIDGLKKGDTLNLTFHGGTSQAPEAATSRATVIVVPDDAESLSLFLMFILILALMTFTGIALREPRLTGAETHYLQEYRDVLIRRVAKLDDVYETGAIPATAYHAKRAELKNQVASLIFRLEAVGQKGQKNPETKTRARAR
jgi:hypothetical protein